MEATLAERGVAAAMSVVREAGLSAEQAVIVQNSNKLAVRILPCDLLARVAVAGQHVGHLEIAVVEGLAARGAPVAALDARVEQRVHERDGFAVTFWTYYEDLAPPGPSPAAYADALGRLHDGMRNLEVRAPHFTARVAEALQLVLNRHASPELADPDRDLLADTLSSADRAIAGRSGADQLLHGEPHPGNVLTGRSGPVFIDFETCCRGPVEFDVAHVPNKVAVRYPGLDGALLGDCRRLVLAMVAAWRWDARDEFPNGRRHGEAIVAILRKGPPWPTLGALDTQ
ncbi:MAG: phosphotransferase enzyme family protein [Acidimicrobiales bacterium]